MTTTPPLHPKPSSRTFAVVDMSTAADGASDTINLTGLTLSAIQMSTDWTDARIGFKGSVDGSTNFYDVYDTSGNFLTYATSASRILLFDPSTFAGLERLKLVSETSAGAAVAQGATRVLKLGLSEFVEAN